MCRHWQELGYLLLYVTARPDMQQKKVLAWLAQHNFPHGMVGFMDGLSADPIRQKLHYIRQIVQEVCNPAAMERLPWSGSRRLAPVGWLPSVNYRQSAPVTRLSWHVCHVRLPWPTHLFSSCGLFSDLLQRMNRCFELQCDLRAECCRC